MELEENQSGIGCQKVGMGMNETYFVQEDTGGTKYISRFGSQSTAAIETIVIQRKEWDGE